MKAKIYSASGKKTGDVKLPDLFSERYRPDLIKRGFHSEESRKFQQGGAFKRAGLDASAESYGPGGGRSRVPRIKAGPRRSGRSARGHKFRSKGRWFPRAMEGALISGARGGRQAHPPKAEKDIVKKLNKKELKKAYRSALAATVNKEIVLERGHKVEKIDNLPIIADDKVSEMKKTSEVMDFLKKIGLEDELDRTSERKIKAGKGKRRGRKYKTPRGILLILPNDSESSAADNILGIDTARANHVSLDVLAPGATAGRLTIITKTALDELKERFE
ncbi:MAG: 50S ribosomal protein L4 [Candidatus Undinarchaeales archaeon]